MPKRKKSVSRKTTKRSALIEYNSLTFILFLVFVLLASFVLVSKVLGSY